MEPLVAETEPESDQGIANLGPASNGDGETSAPVQSQRPDGSRMRAEIQAKISRGLRETFEKITWPDAETIARKVRDEIEQRAAEADAALANRRAGMTRRSADEFVQAIRMGRDDLDGFAGCLIEGAVDLRGALYPHRLVLHDAVFDGPVDLTEAEFDRSLDLSGCTFLAGLSLAQLDVGRQLTLARVVVYPRSPDDPAPFDCFQLRARSLNADAIQVRSPGGWRLQEARIGGGVDARGLCICGHLDFENITIIGPLVLGPNNKIRSIIGSHIYFNRTSIAGMANFNGLAIAHYMAVQGTQFGDNLCCRPQEGNRFEVGGPIHISGGEVAGEVSFNGAAVAGNLNVQNTRSGGSFFCRPESGHRTEILGRLLIGSTEIAGQAVFTGVAVASNMAVHSTRVDALILSIEDGHRPMINGPIIIASSQIAGQTNFDGAAVVGNLDVQGTRISDMTSRPVGGQRTEIGGRVHIADSDVSGQAIFNGAAVAADFEVQNTRIGDLHCRPESDYRTEVGIRVHIDGGEIAGQANFNGAAIAGPFRVQGTHIGGGFYCRPENGHHTQVGGPIYMSNTKVFGQTSFSGVEIAENLSVQDSRLGAGLMCRTEDLNRPWVGGRVLIDGGNINGSIDMTGLTVAGDLIVHNLRVGDLMCLSVCDLLTELGGTEVGGNLHIAGCEVAAIADFRCATVSGSLTVIDSIIKGGFYINGEFLSKMEVVNLTKIGGDLILERNVIAKLEFNGRVAAGVKEDGSQRSLSLSMSKVTDLEFQERLPERLDAEGLRFEILTLPEGTSARELLKATQPFRKATYTHVESWLRNQGEEAAGNAVYRDMRNRDRVDGAMSRAGKVFEMLFLMPIGYGTRTERLLWWFLPTFAIAFGLFSSPRSVERDVDFAPGDLTETEQRFPVPEDEWIGHPMKWALMSLQATLPMFTLPTDLRAVPSDDRICFLGRDWPMTYEVYAGLVSIGNWIAVPLAIAGLSGLIKRKE